MTEASCKMLGRGPVAAVPQPVMLHPWPGESSPDGKHARPMHSLIGIGLSSSNKAKS